MALGFIHFLEKLPHLQPEGAGKLLDVVPRQVGFAALDGAHIGPVHFRPVSKRFLRVSRLHPETANRPSKAFL